MRVTVSAALALFLGTASAQLNHTYCVVGAERHLHDRDVLERRHFFSFHNFDNQLYDISDDILNHHLHISGYRLHSFNQLQQLIVDLEFKFRVGLTSSTTRKSTSTKHLGAIVGGVVGGFALLGLVALGACLYRRRRFDDDDEDFNTNGDFVSPHADFYGQPVAPNHGAPDSYFPQQPEPMYRNSYGEEAYSMGYPEQPAMRQVQQGDTHKARMVLIYYDDANTGSGIGFSAGWTSYVDNVTDSGYYENTYTQRTAVNLPAGGLHADIPFVGSFISVIGSVWHDHGRLYCHLVDLPNEPWVWYNASTDSTDVTTSQTLCSVSGIPSGSHTLRIGAAAEDGQYLNIGPSDGRTTIGGGSTIIASASSTATVAAKHSSSHAVAIGVGVGVGGFALIAILSVMFWYWRRKKASRGVLHTGESSMADMREQKPQSPERATGTVELADRSGFTYHPGAMIGASLGGLGSVERDAIGARGPSVTAHETVTTTQQAAAPPSDDAAQSSTTLSSAEKAGIGAGGVALAATGITLNLFPSASPPPTTAIPTPTETSPPIAAPLSSSAGPQAAFLGEPTTSATDDKEGLSTKEKVFLGAGAAGLAGIGAGAAFEEKDQLTGPIMDKTRSASIASSANTVTQSPTQATTEAPQRAFHQPRDAAFVATKYGPPATEEPATAEAKGKNVERAVEAGVVGGVAAEGVREFAPNDAPLASTAPSGQDPAPSSAFVEHFSPIRPDGPVSRFSDATTTTFAPSLTSSASSSSILHAFNADTYESQRVPISPNLLALGDEPPKRVLTPEDLAASTSKANLAGFHQDQEEMTDAMKDFAHLTPPVPQRATFGSFDAGEDQDQDHQQRNATAAAAVGLGLAGGGAAVLARASSEEDNGPLPSRTYAPPLSRATLAANDRFSTLKSSDLDPSSSSGPSSTRAVKGSPNSTPPPSSPILTRHQSPSPAQPNFGAVEREQDGAGTAGVVLSPHMHIATRKDSIGRNRLHKTSHDRETSAGSGSGGTSPSTSQRRASVGQQTPAEAYASEARNPRIVPASPGEEIWKSSVAQVVNDETNQRGGHRPALVTIDSEDRRDFSSPSRSPPPPPLSHSAHHSTPPDSPSSPGGAPNKLLKGRRRVATEARREGKQGHQNGLADSVGLLNGCSALGRRNLVTHAEF
ncbi:hypothetical protein RQP46_009911 [Phenoliferia psychrophenolica]